MPTPDLLIEIAARHAIYLEGHKTHIVNAFDTFLRDMETDLLSQISVTDMDGLKGRRLNALLKAVRGTLETGFGDYEAVWRKQLLEFAEYESGFEVRALKQVVGAQVVLPSPAQIMTAAFAAPLSVQGIHEGMLLEPFFRDWTGKTRTRVEGAIRLAAAQGQTTAQLVRTLRGTRAAKYRDGILHTTRRDMNLMGRTALQHIASQARAVTWRANADLVEGNKFVAVLDGKTSTLCRGLSGRVFPIDEGPKPPLHLACRSVLVPSLREGLRLKSDGATQFSRGAKGIKQVDADWEYYDFLRAQPAAFQDSVIGPKRGKLLRDGGLSAKRFQELQLNSNFEPLTLDDMRKLEPLAFERAGI